MKISHLIRRGPIQTSARHVLLSIGLISGLAQGQEARIEAYGPSFTQPEPAPHAQARIYAYRASESISPAPINLYLNGRYVASLLRGGYTQFCLQPGRPLMQSALDDAGQLHLGKTLTGQALDTQNGRVLYLRVTEGAGRQTLVQPLSESQALPEIRQTRLQQHTVPRAPEVQTCNAELAKPMPTVAAPVKPAPKRDFTLAADALFEFGKADLKSEGVRSIKTLVRQVQQEYSQIDRIVVLGYTDAIGPVELNRKLSAARAESVVDLLEANGLRPTQGFTARGRGSSELAKHGCKNKPSPENKACHAPNRRVVISVNGSSK